MTPLWVRIHIGDYKADTAHLSTVEHGALLLLRLHYWRQGPVKDNDTTLARIVGLPIGEWKAIRTTLEDFFEVRGGEWANSQWTEEIAQSYASINRASRAGKLAANARWSKQRIAEELQSGYGSDANRTASAMRPQSAGGAVDVLTSNTGGKPPVPPAQAKAKDVFLGVEGDVLRAEMALGIGGAHGS